MLTLPLQSIKHASKKISSIKSPPNQAKAKKEWQIEFNFGTSLDKQNARFRKRGWQHPAPRHLARGDDQYERVLYSKIRICYNSTLFFSIRMAVYCIRMWIGQLSRVFEVDPIVLIESEKNNFVTSNCRQIEKLLISDI